MGPLEWFLECLRKYADFTGRARRAEFWWYLLFYYLVGLLIALVVRLAGGTGGGESAIVTVYSLALLLPTLGVSVRRLHDTNRSGWFLWLSLIPLIGTLVLLAFWVMPGTPGANRYGNPARYGQQPVGFRGR